MQTTLDNHIATEGESSSQDDPAGDHVIAMDSYALKRAA
jgi:hypothetical protein